MRAGRPDLTLLVGTTYTRKEGSVDRFASYVRRRRRDLKLDARTVAEAVGLSVSRWRQIEAGYSARGLTAAQLLDAAACLQVDVRELVELAARREVLS